MAITKKTIVILVFLLSVSMFISQPGAGRSQVGYSGNGFF